MPHDNELKPDRLPEYVSKLSIDAEQWAILEPLVRSASNSVKLLDHTKYLCLVLLLAILQVVMYGQ